MTIEEKTAKYYKQKETLTQYEVLKIHNQAQKYGGSFEKAITVALIRADRDNQLKLQSQFMDIFNKFLKL